MRFRPILISGLAVCLLAVAGLADRALVGEASAGRVAAFARIDEDAHKMAASVGATLEQLERAVVAERAVDGVVAERLAIPPPRVRLAQSRNYGQAPRADLAALLRSAEATPNGLPEAVVARIVLGPATAVTGVEEQVSVVDRLLTGALPVRPEDLPYLARRLGVPDDPRIAPLAARLRRAPNAPQLPEAPDFRRHLLGRDRIEGWSRATTAESRLLVRYDMDVGALLARTPESDRVSVAPAWADAPAETDDVARVVPVPGVDGLTVRVTPRLPGELRLTALRLVLWLSALAGVLGLIGLRRALAREGRAIAHERAFLAGITHELRTPVTAIRVLGETLADGRGDPREYGTLVARESERLEGLVERALTLNRLDHSLRQEDVQPEELLRSAVALMRHRAARRGAEIVCRAPEHLPRCHWDPDAVRRALLNLLENAIVHGREGGRVEASVSVAGDEVLLSVADDGPGIGGADRPRIFARFERGGTDAPGAGLGLYLVDQVARSHGGRVHLETTKGHGSTFTLMLPARPPGSPKEGGA